MELTLEEALAAAQQMQRHGDLAQAEAVYLRIQQAWPGEPNSLHFLGLLRHLQGRNDEALALIGQAAQAIPGHAGVWINLGNVLQASGRLDAAIDAYRRASDLAPNNALVYANLGLLQGRLGRAALAEAALRHALALAPQAGFVAHNLGNLLLRQGRLDEAVALGIQTLGLEPTNAQARRTLCMAHELAGQRAQAQQVLRDWLALEPDNPEALHLLAAVGGLPAPPRAPDAYVTAEFDGFARTFDEDLRQLGYRAPQLLAAALQAALGAQAGQPQAAGDVLDAGCGTGLCAPLLRPLARRLEGVDLSAGMLAQAQRRGGYDHLHQAELQAFIAGRGAAWDTVVCADTLCYFGDLAAVCQAVALALRPGGRFVFSVECAPEGGPGHVLRYHGRYAHTQAHLAHSLHAAGLALLSLQAEALRGETGVAVLDAQGQVERVEALRQVQGWVVVAGKPPTGVGAGPA